MNEISNRLAPWLPVSLMPMVALAPLFIASSGQAQSVMPMAISLCFGLIFSTIVTLCIVPAAYLGVNDVLRFGRWVWHGGPYPTPEMVEETRHEVVHATN